VVLRRRANSRPPVFSPRNTSQGRCFARCFSLSTNDIHFVQLSGRSGPCPPASRHAIPIGQLDSPSIEPYYADNTSAFHNTHMPMVATCLVRASGAIVRGGGSCFHGLRQVAVASCPWVLARVRPCCSPPVGARQPHKLPVSAVAAQHPPLLAARPVGRRPRRLCLSTEKPARVIAETPTTAPSFSLCPQPAACRRRLSLNR
jgi:hypothetical protein